MEEIIDATTLSLNEFLDTLFCENYSKLYPNNHFPTEEMMNAFLDSIVERNDNEIRAILRRFIIHSCTFGLDEFRAESIITNVEERTFIAKKEGRYEYDRRLLQKYLTKSGEVWEGLTWVLDLLPHFPNEAIKAIDAYFLANCQLLPDTWLNALSDCAVIIRARYINYQHPKEVFWSLAPKEFEFLVAALYEEMGYDVNLTKSSYDGGIDVHAARTEISLKEKLVIQCKRYTKKTIGVSDIRNLLGVVSDTKATKGVLITSSTFSSEAKKFEYHNPSIELIDCKNLSQLLNANLGTYWINKIDRIIAEQKTKKIV